MQIRPSTIVHYNGSQFAGQDADSIEVLEARLQEYELESFSGAEKVEGGRKFIGNFKNISAALKLTVYSPSVEKRLLYLFKRNRELAKQGKLK